MSSPPRGCFRPTPTLPHNELWWNDNRYIIYAKNELFQLLFLEPNIEGPFGVSDSSIAQEGLFLSF